MTEDKKGELLALAERYEHQATELAEAMIDAPSGAISAAEALLCPAWFQIAAALRARAATPPVESRP